MSDCTLGRYNDTWITGGTFGSVTACTCPNCTEREALRRLFEISQFIAYAAMRAAESE